MALIKPPPPPDCLAAFTAGLGAFVANPPYLKTEAYVGSAPVIPSLSELGQGPYRAEQVFVLGLNDAAGIAGSAAAVAAGWRFFAGDIPPKVLMGRVSRHGSASPWRMTA